MFVFRPKLKGQRVNDRKGKVPDSLWQICLFLVINFEMYCSIRRGSSIVV